MSGAAGDYSSSGVQDWDTFSRITSLFIIVAGADALPRECLEHIAQVAGRIAKSARIVRPVSVRRTL